MDIGIATTIVGDATVLRLTGVVDISTIARVDAEIRRAVSHLVSPRLLIDLDGATLVDELAIGAMLAAAARVRASQRTFGIVCTSPRLLHLLRSTGVDAILPVHDAITPSSVVDPTAPADMAYGVAVDARYHGAIAVIFASERTRYDDEGYAAAAVRMDALARRQPGFLGIDTARDADGFGITVSYWRTADAAHAWKRVAEHGTVQARGRRDWYQRYSVRVAHIDRAYSFEAPVYHLAVVADWESAVAAGVYTMSTRAMALDDVGFIHCSFRHQLVAVAARFYGDVDTVLVLEIDRATLAQQGLHIVVEPGEPATGELFPHLYGPLPTAAVVSVTPWPVLDGRTEPPLPDDRPSG